MDVLSSIIVPNSPYSLCGRKATLKKERVTAGVMQQASAAPPVGLFREEVVGIYASDWL